MEQSCSDAESERSLVTRMERPAVVNRDQFPPAYNPTYPQPYTYGGEAGISTVTQSGYNVGTDAGMPPEYTQSFEDVNCFSEATVRRGFIRKVYLTLMVQLLITVGIICAFLYWETLKLWVLRTSWFAYTMMGTTLVLVIVLSCCGDVRRKVPLNFIFLGLFTVAEGMLLGSVTVFFNAEAVLWAVGATALVSFGLSLFAMQSKWDFTKVSGSLWVLCWTLFSFGLLCAIMRSQFLYIAYASLGTLFFSVYLVMDTQLLLGGKHKYTISAEEYIFAALNLYLDICTIESCWQPFETQPQRTGAISLVMADPPDGVAHELSTAVSLNRGGTTMKEINAISKSDSQTVSNLTIKSQYCEQLQEWMWQYYCGYGAWHSWATEVFPLPPCFPAQAASGSLRALPGGVDMSNPDLLSWIRHSSAVPFSLFPSIPVSSPSAAANNASERQVEVNTQGPNVPAPLHVQHNGNAQQPGEEYVIPSLLHRFLAEMLDFFILFFIKATIILSIIHLSGMKDISKFALHFIVEEIDEDTSMEDLQKMMLMALVYRILVCFYEIICIWGANGATPGKFLLGLQVVTCDTSVLVQPSRVRVVPASNVSLSASAIRALNKNFSIAFFFPAFITLLFFQHNRTVYDIVAGTIVVKTNRLR